MTVFETVPSIRWHIIEYSQGRRALSVTGQPGGCVALVGLGSHGWFQCGLCVLGLQQNHRGQALKGEWTEKAF